MKKELSLSRFEPAFSHWRRGLIGASFIFLFSLTSHAQTILWQEDFSSEADGASSGMAGGSLGSGWSVTTTPSGGAASFSKQTYAIRNPFGCGTMFTTELFVVNDTGNEGVWQSDVIDISAVGRVSLEVVLVAIGTDATDYVRAYYVLDGGAEVLFGELEGEFLNLAAPSSAVVSGNSLQIVIRGSDNTGGNLYCSMQNVMGFDDIALSDIETLYSIADADWDVGTTWSTTGFAGAPCNCTPDDFTDVIVGNNRTVTITDDADAVSIEVQPGSTLDFSATADLNIHKGGTIDVQAGATFTSAGFPGSQIDYDDAYNFLVDVDGVLTIGDIDVNAAATITLSGTGTLTTLDDILVGAVAEITNNVSGNIVVTDDIAFTAAADFNNNGPLSVASISFTTDNAAFTNSATLTVNGNITASGAGSDDNVVTNLAGGTLNVSGFVPNNGDFDVFNFGTINQSGNFTNISVADTNFDNRATGVWNWTLTPNTTFDADIVSVINLTAIGNTFNYAGAGPQRIIPTSYSNLTLSNSGAKDANNANFSVNGNWTVSGTATFTEGTGTVTLNGSGSTVQVLSNPAGETFYNLIINNTSSENIIFDDDVTAVNSLSLSSGIVDLSGNLFALGGSGIGSDLNRTVSSVTNWMYNGTFRRFWLASTAVSSTAGNLYGLFPVGAASSSSYRPVAINTTSNPTGGGSFDVTHIDGSGVTDLTPAFNDGGTNIVRKHNASFVTAIAGVTGGTYNISVTMTGLPAGTLSDIRLAVSNGATTVTTVGSHGAASGTAQNPTATRTGITVLNNLNNDFRISTTNAIATPLPVELLDFRGEQVTNAIAIVWSTASEIDNDYFTIERLRKDDGFDIVATLSGNGTTNEVNKYEAFDRYPLEGKNYYRLKQTDYDGQFSYSDLIVVDFKGSDASIEIYPNPARNQDVTVRLKNLEPDKDVHMRIINAQGASMPCSNLSVDSHGTCQAVIPTSHLPQGVYMIVIGEDPAFRKKLMIN